MSRSDFLLGHQSIVGRVNVRRELKQIKQNPLARLIDALNDGKTKILSSDISRYQQAYRFYYLSFERYLREMSVATRYSKGPSWVRRSGGKAKYTPAQRKLATQYREIAPFLEYDLVNCLIHSRILLDRAISLARHFLTGKKLPSFTSFNDHKKFFFKLDEPYGTHEKYGQYIREKTDWFEMPLKTVRDKFVVHVGTKHMKFLGYPSGEWELDLNIILPDGGDPLKPLSKVKLIRVNALSLSYDIEGFLKWFCDYGVSSLNRFEPNMANPADAKRRAAD